MFKKKDYAYFKKLAEFVFINYKNQNDMKKVSILLIVGISVVFLLVSWILNALMSDINVWIKSAVFLIPALICISHIIMSYDMLKVSVELLRQEADWTKNQKISDVESKQLSVKDAIIFNAVKDTVLEKLNKSEATETLSESVNN